MHTQSVYKIRHKLTGEWKCQGINECFTNKFFIAGQWHEGHKAIGVIKRTHKLYSKWKSPSCVQVVLDIDNWEVVECSVLVTEVKTVS